jgi:hypothetical protein
VINKEEYTPTINTMKSSLGIISDLCEIFQKNMKDLIDTAVVTKIYKKLEESAKNKSKLKSFLSHCEKSISSIYNN